MQEKILLKQKLAHPTFTQWILEAFLTTFLVYHTKNQALFLLMGLWEDIKKESTSVSNNQLLSSGKRGEFYYRLPNTGGIAIHQAHPIAKITNAYTEGCIGVSESSTATPKKNYEDLLAILGDENVTIYIK